MSMSKAIAGPRRVKVWQADAEWPDDAYIVPAEDYDLIEVDRDIKAANLQLLVEKVLETEVQWCGETARWGEVKPLFDLARSLKQ